MARIQPEYFTAYSSLKMARDTQGVLVAEFHSKGEPSTFTARDHTEFVDRVLPYEPGPRQHSRHFHRNRRTLHRRDRLRVVRKCGRSGGVEPSVR